MRRYKQKYLRDFMEWLIVNRLSYVRLGSLFIVWGWADGTVSIVAVRKGAKYIVRYKHRTIFRILTEAIMNNKLKFCRWDSERHMREYDISVEPHWDGKSKPEEIEDVDD